MIGVPDDEAGEIPAGFVVLKHGQDASAEDIQAFVAEQVATLQADPPAHVHRRGPEVAVGQDPPPGAPRPGRVAG